jgi:tetratricopeptide (TPR) repeat protein
MPGLKFRPEIPETLRKKSRGRLLKIIFLSGIILALLVLGALAALSRLRPGDSPPEDQGFFQTLRDYDRAPGGSSPEFLSRKLDKLEKEAQGVEAYLSVLKRRRALARTDPRFLPPYREAARRAAAAYPYSEPLAAIAAAALIRGQALTRAEELGQYLTVLSSGSFYPLRLSLHILRGDFKDPRTAAEIPSLSTVLGGALPRIRGQIPSGAAESLITCLTILKTLEGGAGAEEIRWGLSEALNPAASPDFLRFAAEYFYDYREPLKAAELFSRLDTEEDFSRQADALWLAEQPAAARNIWTLLAFPAGENSPPASSAAAARSLYNLALYAANPEEAAARYQQLLAPDPAGNGGPSAAAPESRIYGLIRYSRMVGTPLALAVLEEGIKSFPGNPLLDLELLKRRGEFQEPERLIAETWLLLGRHPGSEELSRWAAWYFDFQRRPGETALVLRNAARQGIAAPWTGLHEALGSIYAGNLSRAEDILRALPPEETGWEVFANRGRIYEALRAPAAALEYYETAAAEVQNRKEAARIQLHIARCLRALGRGREIRRVLEYALDLDPGNLKARLELDRLAPAGL